jgi:hypothetical protein
MIATGAAKFEERAAIIMLDRRDDRPLQQFGSKSGKLTGRLPTMVKGGEEGPLGLVRNKWIEQKFHGRGYLLNS